ncbi:multidrug ABC transporter permease/ATP-binding protein [Methylomonas sp. HYX-M1]|uniref:multidrug ABC transporter permease/ATP-binding protein n=1 Tax=Methylomonas sp. HYX-M1 TaxID=3139307 RepID=UPI00345B9AE3
MTLLRLLFNRFKTTLLLAILLSLASAGLSVAVIAFSNERLLQTTGDLQTTLLQFSGLLAAVLIIGTASQICMTKLGHRLVYEMRRTMVKRILDTELQRLEWLGPARLLASLNGDTNRLTSAFIGLPSALYGLALNLGSFAYLAWLSPRLFAAVAGWMAVGVAIAWLLLNRTHQHIAAARYVEDLLYEDYQAALYGRKELALNRDRAKRFYNDEFETNAQTSRNCEIRADIYNACNENWANAMILGAIGLVFYLVNALAWETSAVATTYAVTILFLRTPLTGLIAAIPGLIGGSVALAKLDSLELPCYNPKFSVAQTAATATWRTLTLKNVEYRYPALENGNPFSVGPIDFELRRGELVFLIGGNGSGKTTFSRLLTGLYRPQNGQLLLDGHPLTEAHRPAYRSLFSSVFSDFYLFSRLLGPNGADADPEQIRFWLNQFGLADKVTVEDSKLSDTNLSQGQRKRLALIAALLEDRPVLVLDEWAADQDPEYRRRFYSEWLPLLKASGKTVLAITHDEHYFSVADRIVKMDEGHIHALETRQGPVFPVSRYSVSDWP